MTRVSSAYLFGFLLVLFRPRAVQIVTLLQLDVLRSACVLILDLIIFGVGIILEILLVGVVLLIRVVDLLEVVLKFDVLVGLVVVSMAEHWRMLAFGNYAS